jgi:hypothetical protein
MNEKQRSGTDRARFCEQSYLAKLATIGTQRKEPILMACRKALVPGHPRVFVPGGTRRMEIDCLKHIWL